MANEFTLEKIQDDFDIYAPCVVVNISGMEAFCIKFNDNEEMFKQFDEAVNTGRFSFIDKEQDRVYLNLQQNIGIVYTLKKTEESEDEDEE